VPPSTGAAATPTSDSAAGPAPKDELPNAGYIPGYRRDRVLGMSPYVPRVGTLPGGMTPGYAAPIPTTDWTFRFSGFFTASLQFSENRRVNTAPDQHSTVFHVPPQTVDEYGSFLGTATMPGQWVQLLFAYGNRYVTANVSLTTWNPTDPTTYYQLGSQQFINNAYLSFNLPPVAGFKPHANVGYFYNNYGSLAQYGLGMYTNVLVGGVRGVGENVIVEYDLADNLTVALEDGFMGTRNGLAPVNITPGGGNGGSPTIWPAAWVHHAHIGFEKRGELLLRARLHYFDNWAQDDRAQLPFDNPTTRQIDESYVQDGHIRTYGIDANVSSPIWGYLGAAVSLVDARNAYPVKGIITFGGDGETLTNRWFGGGSTTPGSAPSNGTGKLVVAGLNYTASIGRIISYPVPFNSDGPDLTLNAGFEIAETSTDFAPFDGRVRHKYGVDLLYTFLPFMGVGIRTDRVVPNSKDSDETFHVIAPRLVLKTDWISHETLTILYGKWFYGAHTHPEASSITSGDRLDDQLFAINAQMYW
jgi:hypothetical protein